MCLNYLQQACEGASLGHYFDINFGADEEEHTWQQHKKRGNAQTNRPAHAGLHVHDDRQRDHHREGECEIVPVEEAVDPPPPWFGFGIKLVSPESQIAWAYAASPHHQEREPV